MASKKFYVVWEGNKPGIYDSWPACQLQIKGYPNARYKAFESREQAEAAFKGSYTDFVQKGSSKKAPAAANAGASRAGIILDSICVDAACSGNPGVMEYQGVDTRTRDQIFHQKFELGTNNIGEFLAVVHALALFHRQGKDTPIYTDSRTALGWVRQKKCRTKLEHNKKTAYLFELIERAERWLVEHTYNNKVLKWETESWGEIPADFGRK